MAKQKMRLIAMLFSFSVVTHSFVVQLNLPVRGKSIARRKIRTTSSLRDTEADAQDWRAFRAKLVMQEGKDGGACNEESEDKTVLFRRHQQHTTERADEAKEEGPLRWIHEQKFLELGSILLHTPRPQDVSGLGQQHLYQSVILIIESSPNDETIGIILNRAADYALNENDYSSVMYFGGDQHCSLLNKPDPKFYVLHHSEFESFSCDFGLDILPGLSIMKIDGARNLIETYYPNISESTTYSGHVTFNTFALQAELKAGIWTCLSVDSLTLRSTLTKQKQHNTLLQDLDHNKETLRDTLLRKARLSHRICNYDEANSRDHNFDRRMFEAWRKVHFTLNSEDNFQPEQVQETGDTNMDAGGEDLNTSSFQSGDLLFSAASEFLFYGQEFRKAFVLILQDDEDLTVGVLLSHPSTKTEPTLGLPIRYGGNFGYLVEEVAVDGDNETIENELPPFCLHYLGDLVRGEPIGDFFHKASINDAARAIEEGVASPEDFLVVQGMTVWPKGDRNCCGLSGSFRKIDPIVNPQVIWNAWKTLGSQEALSPLHMESNIDIARKAWNIAAESITTTSEFTDNDKKGSVIFDYFFGGKRKKVDSDCGTKEFNRSSDDNTDLGFDAVKTWLAVYLLDDPDYRP
mmetsp:Transcript_14373/g.21212  ORF Transcript_14373/g.21212 Transcript_14373/m.21212 type:complete len:632 (+) Transcript_14373:170-2065(+)|eukprot:CAMPEP_0194212634 /NCGR_PEP_ID=MMETSP0156-20130528/12675_1 /TAXON_ID=33649 /ORGANISM="Thalassionema nitzschioides, Strain L26-B" /LENGTH=631 /DNA_ID=CAMNT_0038940505 /DNA_START=96 /DNA_END=1991 /DNA_ORIENTATION=-